MAGNFAEKFRKKDDAWLLNAWKERADYETAAIDALEIVLLERGFNEVVKAEPAREPTHEEIQVLPLKSVQHWRLPKGLKG